MRVPPYLGTLFAWMTALLDSSSKFKPASEAKQVTEPDWEYSQDSVEGCRERAASDLQDADTAEPRQRKWLIKGAERWTLRADMLARMAKSFRKRAALDEASRQYHRDKARQGSPPV